MKRCIDLGLDSLLIMRGVVADLTCESDAVRIDTTVPGQPRVVHLRCGRVTSRHSPFNFGPFAQQLHFLSAKDIPDRSLTFLDFAFWEGADLADFTVCDGSGCSGAGAAG